jgi:Tfp pilus assembly protein PilN
MSAPVAPTPTEYEISSPRRLEGPVRVNLLPESTRQRDRTRRQQGGMGVSLLALLLVLSLIWFLQNGQFSNLEAELATEQEELSRLRGERSELAAYVNLDARLTAAGQRIQSALMGEVSFAGVLQDVAAVTPADTGFTSLTLNLERPAQEAQAPTGVPIGTLNLTGNSLTGHAPGVERILLELDKVFHFDEPFFNSSTVDEDGVATFSLDVGLLPSSRTGRYDDGVPEVLR